MNVICPGCGESYHETTKEYTSSRPANGAMFALKPTWVERGWSAFPNNDGVAYGGLECPGCLTLYCDSAGYILKMEGVELPREVIDNTPPIMVEPPKKVKKIATKRNKLVCPNCGKVYQRSNHFNRHVKWCK